MFIAFRFVNFNILIFPVQVLLSILTTFGKLNLCLVEGELVCSVVPPKTQILVFNRGGGCSLFSRRGEGRGVSLIFFYVTRILPATPKEI